MIGNPNEMYDNDAVSTASVDTSNDVKYIDITYEGDHESLIEEVTNLTQQALEISKRYDFNSIEKLRTLRNELTYHFLELTKLSGHYTQRHKMAYGKRKNQIAIKENELLGSENPNTNKKYTSAAATSKAKAECVKLAEEELYFESMSLHLNNLRYTVQTAISVLNQDFAWLRDTYNRGEILND